MSSSRCSRRSLLKSGTLGVSALAVKGVAKPQKAPQINPAIDNMRVVYSLDKNMVGDNGVDAALVSANMDTMAMQLTQTNSADVAWKTIFRKPSNKKWNEVTVALKPNNLASGFKPSPEVLSKICTELNKLGVTYTNINVYDTVAAKTSNAGKTTGLPSGVQAPKTLEWMQTDVPAPFNKKFGCIKIAHDADIIVNIAVNKGHSGGWGKVTLCMKNHLGTFDPIPFGDKKTPDTHASFEYLLALNKSPMIIGGDIPKQQLCIVDSLWATKGGPGVSKKVSDLTGYLVMGTFAPAVDYLTTIKIREEVREWSHAGDGKAGDTGPKQQGSVEDFLTTFGYAKTDPQWITAKPTAIGQQATPSKRIRGLIPLEVRKIKSTLHVAVTHPDLFSVQIFSPNGKLLWRRQGTNTHRYTINSDLLGTHSFVVITLQTTQERYSVQQALL